MLAIPCLSPVIQGAAIETLVIEVEAFAPGHGAFALSYFIENIRLISQRINGNATLAIDGKFYLFLFTLVSQLIEINLVATPSFW